ncbi:hypothetical protein GCM10025875_18520 [Litorihabitans aurantiacus]|uniref:Uncharacterized protein n=1 Tax=Litorihabitans aurantiacus TaxID=1930061 RepID=A0AA37XF35_9MICO|nr:hypothetical protein GCM10025875_18520 [Litorihabitans aurantiacus]
MRRTVRRAATAVLAVAALAALWEGYKALGPADGWSVGATRLLPRTSDLAMPHTWDVLARLGRPVTGGGTPRSSGSRSRAPQGGP